MSTDTELRISRSHLYADGADAGTVKKIGKGSFTTAYLHTVGRKNRVLLVVKEDASGDYSKSALFELNRDGHANPHLPKVTRAGWMGGMPVYEMPLYDAPLKKGNSEKAWAQYRVLKKCWDTAEAAMRKQFGRDAGSPYNGHWQMDFVVECARQDKAVTRSLATALATLKDYMANYGSDYSFEFSPRNLATDARGRLILLDTTFSRLSIQRKYAATRLGW